MDIIATFKTDEDLEAHGKWFPLSKTAKVLVARSGNDAYQDALRKGVGEAQLDLTPKEEAEALAQEVLIDVMAKHILLGWEGVTENGVEVKYSVAKAKQYLAIKDFRRKIDAFSTNFEAFRVKAEADQGND